RGRRGDGLTPTPARHRASSARGRSSSTAAGPRAAPIGLALELVEPAAVLGVLEQRELRGRALVEIALPPRAPSRFPGGALRGRDRSRLAPPTRAARRATDGAARSRSRIPENT